MKPVQLAPRLSFDAAELDQLPQSTRRIRISLTAERSSRNIARFLRAQRMALATSPRSAGSASRWNHEFFLIQIVLRQLG
jgi:hypothetical protein